jgi:tungstate transport system substrate-binding protein
MKKILMLLLAVAMLLSLVAVLPACNEEETPTATITPIPTPLTVVPPLPPVGRLTVATTTSLYDTGLWSYLEPMFEQKYGVNLNIISVGSGKAFTLGKSGDVDVLTVHEPKAEQDFLAGNYSSARVVFAYNYFVIVGPPSDPAGIKDMAPVDAFKKLITEGNVTGSQVKFVSRGDGSGTHAAEQRLWNAAGYQYTDVEKSGSWYIEAGSGMGPTLVMANEKQAYTLSDMGTFISYKTKLNLVALVNQQNETLLNVYCVMVVNSTKNKTMANNLVTFLTSPEVQDLMGKYGVAEYGTQLFTPCAGQNL